MFFLFFFKEPPSCLKVQIAKRGVSITLVLLFIFVLITTGHRMVADGSVSSGFGVIVVLLLD